jgi:hypothetical protein
MTGNLVTRLGDDLKGPRDMLVMPSMSLTSGDEDDLNMTFSDKGGGMIGPWHAWLCHTCDFLEDDCL